LALITIRLSDETFQKYAQYDMESPERALQRQLEANKDHDPGQRRLVVSGQDLSALERAVGKQFETATSLLHAFGPLAQLKLDEVQVSLTEWQRKRLLQAATFAGKEPSAFLEDLLKRSLQTVLGAS
jgi:hypothetical protein